MLDKPVFSIYEVFMQKDQMSPHVHVGSVDAGTPEDALLLARENFLRRDEAVSLWVVRQDAIHATPYSDPDWFAHPAEKAYRMTQSYARENNDRWRKYKKRMLTLDDVVKD